VALVRKRTVPTERPPRVSEVLYQLQFCVVRGPSSRHVCLYLLVAYVMTLSIAQIIYRWLTHVRILFVTCMHTLLSNDGRKAKQLPTLSLCTVQDDILILGLAVCSVKLMCSYSELLGHWTFPIVRCSWEQKHDVSETESVSILRWRGGKAQTQLGPLERAFSITGQHLSDLHSYINIRYQPAELAWSRVFIVLISQGLSSDWD
jgi:hypothetical protein